MKGLIRGILTIWIFVLLIIFGMSICLKGMLIDTTDVIVKKEIKNEIITSIEGFTEEKLSDDVIKKIEKEIDNNKNIKKIMNNYYDKILESLSNNGETVTINIEKELESLINDGEKILKEYGINITKEEKDELLSIVTSEEINEIVNDSITEIKSDISDETKAVIEVYAFITSITFKIIVIGLIAISLLFIGLLKDKIYNSLSNLGISSILAGLFTGLLLPIFIKEVLSDTDVMLSTTSLNTYGYILIGIGIISYIVKYIINKQRITTKEEK